MLSSGLLSPTILYPCSASGMSLGGGGAASPSLVWKAVLCGPLLNGQHLGPLGHECIWCDSRLMETTEGLSLTSHCYYSHVLFLLFNSLKAEVLTSLWTYTFPHMSITHAWIASPQDMLHKCHRGQLESYVLFHIHTWVLLWSWVSLGKEKNTDNISSRKNEDNITCSFYLKRYGRGSIEYGRHILYN